ncbi:MAG: hypothetical protein ACTSP1_17840 [Candidatus Freyarchaeota archaeon]
MLPIIENRTNRLIYTAEKRDGSGPVTSGTNVHLKIHNITDDTWWTGTEWGAETELNGTHLSNGVWYYDWATPDGDAGDRVEWFFYDETDETVVLYEQAEIQPEGGLAKQSTVEAGFESLQHSNWTVLYVDIDATGEGDGSSWEDAFTSIQDALDAASDKTRIFVAAGTYAEAVTISNNYIQLASFDFDTPFPLSPGSVIITGDANTPSLTIQGDNVQIYGLDLTDHPDGERDGVLIDSANDVKITKCNIFGLKRKTSRRSSGPR